MSQEILLNELIKAQRDAAVTMSRVEQKLDSQHERLFGTGATPGIVVYMNDQIEKTKTRVTALEGWKLGSVKWIAGAVAVLTLEGTALAAYVKYAAAAMKALTGNPHP